MNPAVSGRETDDYRDPCSDDLKNSQSSSEHFIAGAPRIVMNPT